MICCLLVLDSVTSTSQWVRQPRPREYLKEATYHTRLFRGPSTNHIYRRSLYIYLFISISFDSCVPDRRRRRRRRLFVFNDGITWSTHEFAKELNIVTLYQDSDVLEFLTRITRRRCEHTTYACTISCSGHQPPCWRGMWSESGCGIGCRRGSGRCWRSSG